MASANVTCAGSSGREIECDTAQKLATLLKPGGTVSNKDATTSAWINDNGGTVDATDGSATSLEIKAGASVKLPIDCASFSFKTASGTAYLQYTPA